MGIEMHNQAGFSIHAEIKRSGCVLALSSLREDDVVSHQQILISNLDIQILRGQLIPNIPYNTLFLQGSFVDVDEVEVCPNDVTFIEGLFVEDLCQGMAELFLHHCYHLPQGELVVSVREDLVLLNVLNFGK